MITEIPAKEYFSNLEKLSNFHTQFNEGNDDRGSVISGIAYVDDLLGQLLVNFLPENSKTVEKTLKSSGCLGNISAKLDLCYCLGFIEKTIYKDLLIAIEIRNKFAHKLQINFDDKKVQYLCSKFQWYKHSIGEPPSPAPPNIIFNVAINQVVSHLSGMVTQPISERRKIKFYSYDK